MTNEFSEISQNNILDENIVPKELVFSKKLNPFLGNIKFLKSNGALIAEYNNDGELIAGSNIGQVLAAYNNNGELIAGCDNGDNIYHLKYKDEENEIQKQESEMMILLKKINEYVIESRNEILELKEKISELAEKVDEVKDGVDESIEEISRLDRTIDDMKDELKDEINDMKDELKDEINDMKDELKDEINDMKDELKDGSNQESEELNDIETHAIEITHSKYCSGCKEVYPVDFFMSCFVCNYIFKNGDDGNSLCSECDKENHNGCLKLEDGFHIVPVHKKCMIDYNKLSTEKQENLKKEVFKIGHYY